MLLIRNSILCREIDVLYSVYEHGCVNVNMNEYVLGLLEELLMFRCFQGADESSHT